MGFSNPLLVELVIPKSSNNAARVSGFYSEIGWEIQEDSISNGYTYVRPRLNGERAPTIVYGQNSDPVKTSFFISRTNETRSKYTQGSMLPFAFDLVEICMAVPTNEDVVRLYQQGGELLQSHIHVPMREYHGVQEFRFVDPFNYVIRVTVDPGWEA